MGGESYCGRSSVVMPEVQTRAARVFGRYLVSDRIQATCACSSIGRRHLQTILPLSSCCTGALKPQRDTILEPDGRRWLIVTVLHCFCRSNNGPTIPMAVLIGFSLSTVGAIKAKPFRFGRWLKNPSLTSVSIGAGS